MTPGTPIFAIDPRESIDAELTRKLLDFVLSGSLQPGARLPSERDLAQSLGVGRQAVRNAVKSLAVLGIVETRVGSGTYFVGRQSALLPSVLQWGVLLSQSRVDDIIDAWVHLEVLVARLAAQRRTADQLVNIQAVFTQMQAVGANHPTYTATTAGLHEAIAQSSGNVIFEGVLSNIASVLKGWSDDSLRSVKEADASLAMYESLVEAIRASDADAATAAMQLQMMRSVRLVRDAIAASPPG